MEEVKHPKYFWVNGISARDLRGHRIRRQYPNLLGEVLARLVKFG